MRLVRTYYKKGMIAAVFLFLAGLLGLSVRLGTLMLLDSGHYQKLAEELHTRERSIKAARGEIYDRNGTLIAGNRTVCTISVIYNQIRERETVIRELSQILELEEAQVRKKVEKYSAREIIASNVEKETGDAIRELNLEGVKVDEDYKRFYPFGELASKVLGFTGSENQGIIGLEAEYEQVLKGVDGSILTYTDAAGMEVSGAAENRVEPLAGNCLNLSLDMKIQSYVTQVCSEVMEKKGAKAVSSIIMNPQNGEIYAMVNVPEFDLNAPYQTDGMPFASEEERMDYLNQLWRNGTISDTYEPGSTFKIITAAAALEEGVVTLEDSFSCGGAYVVDDRRIRCHKAGGHGAETFLQGIENSCNPVFIQVGLRLGVERFYHYFQQFELLEKTGVDLPGEAVTIMHQPENMKDVELATVSFGQSFQLTALRLLTTASEIVNGGTKIVPHLGVSVMNADRTEGTKIEQKGGERILSEEVSKTMQFSLEKVVSEGGGKRAYLEGYSIGGKTATSEKLPRGNGKYMSSFIGFSPAENPEVIAILIINEPQGLYYGGVIAAPEVAGIFEKIFPYLGIERAEPTAPQGEESQ